VCRRGRSSGRFCLYCTRQISFLWSSSTVLCRTSMLTTLRLSARDVIRQFLLRCLEICIADVASWMSSNRLQLNTSKTELMWCSSFGRRHQVPTNRLIIGLDDIKPVATVKNLGLYLDATMSMRNHISRLALTCYGVLWCLATDPLHSVQFAQSCTYNALNIVCLASSVG